MFDDPQKELKRLEEQLLKTEDDDFEQFYQKIFEEFGPVEEQEQPAAVQKKKTSTYADIPRAVAPKKKGKGVRGLLILICLECLGIAGVILWWVLRLI
jgi:hypothetical protein